MITAAGGRRRPWMAAPCAGWMLVAAAAAAIDQSPLATGDAAGPGNSAIEEFIGLRERANQAAQASQAHIDEIASDTERMAAEYRAAIKETAALRIYNRQVEDLLAAQEREIQSLRRQIDGVTDIGRQITPLMLRMIDALEAFVQLDLPFLQEERSQRLAGLREMMNRADVTISEKYRRLLEAYQIENEYGRTIEAYRGQLQRGGSARTVDFLRIGRVALLYQTLDAGEVGAWDAEEKAWITLGSEYRTPVRDGLRIARKQAAPDLITIPVRAAEVAR